MYTFVKIEGHDCWFLAMLEGDKMTTNKLDSIGGDVLWQLRHFNIKYHEHASEGFIPLVRATGTWMGMSSIQDAIELVHADKFPS